MRTAGQFLRGSLPAILFCLGILIGGAFLTPQFRPTKHDVTCHVSVPAVTIPRTQNPHTADPTPAASPVVISQTSLALKHLFGATDEQANLIASHAMQLPLTGNPINCEGEQQCFERGMVRMVERLFQQGTLPFNKDMYFGDRGADIIRAYIDKFLEKHAIPSVTQHRLNSCMEFMPKFYFDRFPTCKKLVEYHYATQTHHDSNTVRGDLSDPNHVFPEGVTDMILGTQVLEHTPDPLLSLKNMYKMLTPGGLLVFSVPFLEYYHAIPGDYFRYTAEGVNHLLTQAGFTVSDLFQGGTVAQTTLRYMGMGTNDIELEKLDIERVDIPNVRQLTSRHADTIMALAWKPK